MSNLRTSAKDFILDDIVGSMMWHGETSADNKSAENMEVAFELVLSLVAGISDNAMLTNNAIATASGEKLNSRAKRMLESLIETCEEADL